MRPSPSLRRYPKDCPPLKTRWFYAVDVPKRKPFADSSKAAPVPKKLIPFSSNDSQSIESAFQALDKGDNTDHSSEDSPPTTLTKVPVNEDYLFDVNIEHRELEPAYWIGPVYEVRRGSWFYQESSGLRPCDEKLANQLEEGYLKIAPWRKVLQKPRSASQPRGRPTSLILESIAAAQIANSSTPGSPAQVPVDAQTAENSSYRLFGAHMNTTVTYQDSTNAWLTADDFMSRMSSTVYSRFGSLGGTKVVRGYIEGEEASTRPDKTVEDPKKQLRPPEGTKDAKRSPIQGNLGFQKEKAGNEAGSTASRSSNQPSEAPTTDSDGHLADDATEGPPTRRKRSALERQLSSLAGIPSAQSSEDLAEEARQEEEREMEDYREPDAGEQGREIEHLVLITHGVGQRLGLRLDSINFIHDVNTLRKTMKGVYASAPDLQALNSQLNDLPSNCRVQVLPVCWRHLLDFPKQSVRENRKEHDLGDSEGIDEDDYPSLADITVDGVPAVRNLITDLAMDVLLYQSAYREHIAGIVQRECNRIFKLFKERNPSFSGRVSLIGHSLGSAILFDILCRQRDSRATTGPRNRVSSRSSKDPKVAEQRDLHLDFDCENFFCLGSPIALFQMLKGRTVAGRTGPNDVPPESPFDPDPLMNDPFLQPSTNAAGGVTGSSNLLPITISSPKCSQLFNIFHPTDPIAYRLEPLIAPAMSSLKPQPLPYTKKGLFGAPGIANIGARVGQSVGSMWYSLTSGVASSLINRSLGITGEEQALPQDSGALKILPKGASSTTGDVVSAAMPVADDKKQKALAEATRSSTDPDYLPTLIDSELETLYAGFEKSRRTRTPGSGLSKEAEQSSGHTSDDQNEYEEASDRAKKLKREEAKVRALNSNGRVDYSIQEGIFDISLLASIASHLSYWADEDVNHFMVGQMLKRGREKEAATHAP